MKELRIFLTYINLTIRLTYPLLKAHMEGPGAWQILVGGKNNIKEIVSAIITCIFFTTAPPTRPPVPGSGLARRRRLPRCNPSRLIRLPSLREISQSIHSICRWAIHRSHSPPDRRRHPAPTPPHLRCEDEGRRGQGWDDGAEQGRRWGAEGGAALVRPMKRGAARRWRGGWSGQRREPCTIRGAEGEAAARRREHAPRPTKRREELLEGRTGGGSGW